MAPKQILIAGGGISGLCSALALSKELPDVRITIFERHPVPSTSGGAISLSPVALRHLDYLGVLTQLDHLGCEAGVEVDAIEIFSVRSGKSLGSLDFVGRQRLGYAAPRDCRRYKGRRVMRINLTLAIMAAIDKLENVRIVFGMKLVGCKKIESDRIAIQFQDGTMATGDLLLGCDGVHSATRTTVVDPGAQAEYSGFSLVQTTMPATSLRSSVHFRSASLNVSRQGSLLMSFCDQQRRDLFLSAMVECREDAVMDHQVERWSRQDPHRQALISDSLRHEVLDRFGTSSIPAVREAVQLTEVDWLLYPIYQIPPGRRWYSDRAILLGDAAHAVSGIPSYVSLTRQIDR